MFFSTSIIFYYQNYQLTIPILGMGKQGNKDLFSRLLRVRNESVSLYKAVMIKL